MGKKKYKRPSVFNKTLQATTASGLMAAAAVLSAVGTAAAQFSGSSYKTVRNLAFQKGRGE